MRKRRARVVEEILETERTYVRELETLDRLYIQKSRESGVLTLEEIRTVFGDIGGLELFHRAHLLPALEEAVSSAGEGGIGEARVGRVFAQHSAYIKMYSAYVNNMDRSLHTITSSLAHRSDWTRLALEARADPSHTQLGLQGFLLLPVQRIPRYRLLLDELSGSTPAEHEDAKDLEVALREMHRRAEEINERKRDFERSARVLDLQGRI
ncbi:MAG: Dbl homology domain-containing protein, partial [Piptocephalis tieghemiana]